MAEHPTRKLAVILHADVVGSTALVHRDEERAHRRMRDAFRRFSEIIVEHGGTANEIRGDALVAVFDRASDSVTASLTFQSANAAHNEGTEDEIRPVVRIGIAMGEVVVADGTVTGAGVVLAQRLEQLAEPGGVVIQGAAAETVPRRMRFAYENLGEPRLKGFDEPVRLLAVTRKRHAETRDAAAPDAAEKPSIAVLPFTNMSGDSEQEFFADGIAEDIITALSKIVAMRVIARNSSFVHKGASRDLRAVAQDLGVRYVLEGSVRRGGDRLRITAQLIEAQLGSHVWAERYDRPMGDLFDIQDEITKEIVTALRVRLTDGEVALVSASGTSNVGAWECCARATELFMRFSAADYLEARRLAERAVDMDPDYAHAWAVLGFTYFWEGRLGFSGDPSGKFRKAEEYADRAMSLDDTVSWSIGSKTLICGVTGRHDEAISLAQKGVDLYPGNADVRAFYAFALSFGGRHRDAVEQMRAAMELNPHTPHWYRTAITRSLVALDRLDEALMETDLVANESANLILMLLRASVLCRLGRIDEARASVAVARRHAPELRAHQVDTILLEPTAAKTLREAAREVGLPE